MSKIIFEQLVAGDVARVHAGDRMVHQQLGIDLGHACNSGERPVALAQVIAARLPVPVTSRCSLVNGYRRKANLLRNKIPSFTKNQPVRTVPGGE